MAIFVQVNGVALSPLLELTLYTIVQILLTTFNLIIFKASPIKFRREHLAVRLLNIKNSSGTAEVCLFRDNAEMNL